MRISELEMVSVKVLLGKDVVEEGARVIGKTSGAHIDLSQWSVTHLQIKLTEEAIKEFGYKKPLLGSVEVLLPVGLIKAVGDLISINKNIEELRTILKPIN